MFKNSMKIDSNPFSLFAIEPCVEIDLKGLDERYHELQKRFHPDQFWQSPVEKLEAERLSSLINQAYEILKDPLKRMGAVVEKITGEDIEKLSVAPLDPEFLEQVLEWRENLQESRPEITQCYQACEKEFLKAFQTQNIYLLKETYHKIFYLYKTLSSNY